MAEVEVAVLELSAASALQKILPSKLDGIVTSNCRSQYKRCIKLECSTCLSQAILDSQVQQYESQMQLLQQGRLIEASRITTGIGAAVSICLIRIICPSSTSKQSLLSDRADPAFQGNDEPLNSKRPSHFSQVAKASNEVLDEEGEEALRLQGGSFATDRDDFTQRPKHKGSPGAETVHTMEAARECQLEFFKRMPGSVCANCGAHNPTIKK